MDLLTLRTRGILREQVVVGAGSFTDMLEDVEAVAGRPLVVTPATRPDLILGIGAAQACPSALLPSRKSSKLACAL